MHVNSSKSTYNYRWWTVCSVYLHMTSSTAKTNSLARARLPIKMRMHWKKKHNDEPWSACNRCATKINRLKNTDTVHIQRVSNQRIELKPYYMCKSETPQIKRKQRVLCFVSWKRMFYCCNCIWLVKRSTKCMEIKPKRQRKRKKENLMLIEAQRKWCTKTGWIIREVRECAPLFRLCIFLFNLV